jgi:hypothetical protein
VNGFIAFKRKYMKKARKKHEALIEYEKNGMYSLMLYHAGDYKKLIEAESPSDLLQYALDKYENDFIMVIPPVIEQIISCEAFEYHSWVKKVEQNLLDELETGFGTVYIDEPNPDAEDI